MWARPFELKYLWVGISAVRSETGRGLEDFTGLLYETQSFYGNNLISFLRSRPSTTRESNAGDRNYFIRKVKTDTTPAEIPGEQTHA